MPSDAPTAFFSYSREDSEFALRLAEDLKAAGAGVWIDQLDIEPGREWDNAIEDALTQCPRMLLILTAASVKSPKVRNEIAFALDEQKNIIPVLYQDCTVPLQLRRIQHIDFRTDYARGLKALLKTLSVQQPAPSPAAVSTLKKIALAVCGILVVALILYWATRPRQGEVRTQTPVVQTQPSSPPPTAEVSSGSAAAERAAADKLAADKANADKAAADKAAARKVAADKAAGDKAARDKATAAAQAMNEKGEDYRLGRGVTQDYQQAVSFYREAADAGNAAGMNNLGWMYYNGGGVKKDYAQAVTWYRKAAEAGNASGMNNLGWMYEWGYGVRKDQQQAIFWYRKGAQLGDDPAENNLRRLGAALRLR